MVSSPEAEAAEVMVSKAVTMEDRPSVFGDNMKALRAWFKADVKSPEVNEDSARVLWCIASFAVSVSGSEAAIAVETETDFEDRLRKRA